MPLERIRRPEVLLMSAALLAGLAADPLTGIEGQLFIGAAFWGVLVHVCRRVEARERQGLVACLAVATAGELFLSLGWGVYAYRLGNVPLFVPPGHVLMYLLAAALARNLPDAAAWAVAAAAGIYAAVAAAAGFDTFALPLFAAYGIALAALPRERRVLAATLALSLLLELYGTALGVWTWVREVPVTGWATTNPPALSGALYVIRDALMIPAAALLARAAPSSAPAPAAGT